jgi:hypothetical protein
MTNFVWTTMTRADIIWSVIMLGVFIIAMIAVGLIEK